MNAKDFRKEEKRGANGPLYKTTFLFGLLIPSKYKIMALFVWDIKFGTLSFI
jgi:hypothetical protein